MKAKQIVFYTVLALYTLIYSLFYGDGGLILPFTILFLYSLYRDTVQYRKNKYCDSAGKTDSTTMNFFLREGHERIV